MMTVIFTYPILEPEMSTQPVRTLAGETTSGYARERQRYWDEFAGSFERWQRVRGFYQGRLAELYRFLVPPGMRVLELGCARGDLLATLRPERGVGVDLSPVFVECARRKYPQLEFRCGDAHHLDLGETFDYIICSDLVNDLWDVQRVCERIAAHSKPETRVILNFYSRVWELPRRLSEALGLVKRQLPQNWLTADDLAHLLYLANFEVIRTSREVLCPLYVPLLGQLINRCLVKLWPCNLLALTNFLVARPQPRPVPGPEPVVSVIVPARNEEGNIRQIFDRVPQMGAGTELIFVEGNSKDDTYGAIQREIPCHPNVNARLLKQPGKGKGDAVRTGFANATGQLLMILDADLTVAPEDLPRFYSAWRTGKAEFVNGVRLVYPMEERAMRFFNHIANRFFSWAFTWLLGQSIKDTLCGTKVLGKSQYEMIAANRAYFGEIDPFGDFDLLFGAAHYNMKMVDLPIRYRERTYGETNIQRWRHGALLLKMLLLASRKLKFI